MYKTTYIVLSIYSGSLFFMYLPAYNYMDKYFHNTDEETILLSLYIWMTWIIKPIFGYLCDYFPLCHRRITPYVVIACISNIVLMTTGALLDLQSYIQFIVLFCLTFIFFSIVDAAARKLVTKLRRHDQCYHGIRRQIRQAKIDKY